MTRTPRLIIMLPGYAIDDTDPRHAAFDSQYTSIKIFKKITNTVTVGANSNSTVTLSHNVGFFPLAQLYVELTPGSGRWYAAPFFNITGEDGYVSGDFSDSGVNSSNAVFKIFNKTASSKTFSYYCFVLAHDGK